MIYILYQNKFGGTDLLLKRLEIWLKNNGYDVASDNSDIKAGIDISLIITPTSEMNRIYYLKERGISSQKVLVWCMGHGAFKAAFYNKKFENFLFGIPKITMDYFIRRFAMSLIKTNSIVFTDEVGLHYDLSGIDLSKCHTSELLCPIAIKNYAPTCALNNSDELIFGWVGRISRDFKVLPLLKLIEDLEATAAKQHKRHKLIIVGDGDGASSLEPVIEHVTHLTIDWIREIENHKILKFIDDNIDILFAMGTSSLDGANTATPTVIVQPFSSENEKSSKGYRWIFESKGFSLGEFPNTNAEPTQIEVSIESIFSDIEIHGLSKLAKNSKQYSVEFYEDNVFSKMFGKKSIGNTQADTLMFFKFLTWFNKTKIMLKKILSALNSRGAKQS